MADDSPNHTGGMIALIPESPSMLAVAGGEPEEEIHLTLAYLGDDVDADLGPEVEAALRERVGRLATGLSPVNTTIFGHASWNPDSEDGPAVVYQVQGTPELQAAHTEALALAQEQVGMARMPKQHEPFLPHVTAGYGIDPSTLSYSGPVRFTTLRLAWGDDTHDFPLVGGDMPRDDTVPSLVADGGTRVDVDFPALIVEGLATGDGRTITPGALSHRTLPLHILAQTQNPVGGQGHDGAYVVGQLEHLERVPGPEVTSRETGEPFPEGTFVWRGKGWVNPNVPGGDLVTGTYNEESGKWEGGVLRGNSGDLTEVEAEFAGEDGDSTGVNINAGKISATTMCPIPAFADSYVVVDGIDLSQPSNELAEDAQRTPMWRSDELGDDTCLHCALDDGYEDGFGNVSAEKRKRAESKGKAMPGGRFPVENAEDLQNAIHAVGRAKGGEAERNKVRRHIIKQAKRLGLQSKIPDNWNSDGSLKASGALVAAATKELLPPAWMFDDPKLDGPTPLTIEKHGDWRHVYGHLAPWGACHTGILSQCRTAPKSKTNYAYFHVGAVRASGENGPVEVPVGHITMDTGHEPDSYASAQAAAAHYDNTGTVVADITAGEDRHGVWVSGALRRKVSADKEAELLAAPLSGDWRPVAEGMELVAALAVNQPGFLVRRTGTRAMVASGAVTSLQITTDPTNPVYTAGQGATGAVVLDYDQLADAIAVRLADRGINVADPTEQAEAEEEAEEQKYALELRARRAGALLELS